MLDGEHARACAHGSDVEHENLVLAELADLPLLRLSLRPHAKKSSEEEEIDGVMWYSGAAAHRRLGLTETHVRWITTHMSDFRKRAFKEIGAALR